MVFGSGFLAVFYFASARLDSSVQFICLVALYSPLMAESLGSKKWIFERVSSSKNVFKRVQPRFPSMTVEISCKYFRSMKALKSVDFD